MIRPGRYTVRIAYFHPFDFEYNFGDAENSRREKRPRRIEKRVRVVSNPVTFTIVRAKDEQPPTSNTD